MQLGVVLVFLFILTDEPSQFSVFSSDGKPMRDYGVEDGSKITLVKKPSSSRNKSNPSASSPASTPQKMCLSEPESPVWEKMRAFLRRHFRECDVEPVLKKFREVC